MRTRTFAYPATRSRMRCISTPLRPALLTANRGPMLRRWLATSLTDETDAQRWLDAQAAG
ncbi:hypothetical protein [Lentzea atacamensis]|uniref:hypothetical protein n=1 Tax=Lentzea atacamensis TaxID=531938 RepID=UPI0011BD8810|nr:hypothetical protein [Lentzea atacamensis]